MQQKMIYREINIAAKLKTFVGGEGGKGRRERGLMRKILYYRYNL